MIDDFVLGVVLVAFGAFTLVARVLGWSSVFRKAEPMKHTLGPWLGTSLHIAAYTVLPLVAGAIFLNSELGLW